MNCRVYTQYTIINFNKPIPFRIATTIPVVVGSLIIDNFDKSIFSIYKPHIYIAADKQ